MPPRHDKDQGLYKYRDGTWGIDCYIGNRRLRRKVGKKSDAREELARIKNEAKEGRFGVTPRSVRRKTLGQWLEDYGMLAKGETNTVYARMWTAALGHLYPEQLTILLLRQWVANEIGAGVKAASIHRKVSVIRAAFNLAVNAGEVDARESPFLDPRRLGLPKINNLRENLFSGDQLACLRDRLGFFWPYAEFSLLTGVRWGSLAQLQWEDVDFERKFAMCWTTKNGYRHPVELAGRALAILRLQLERRAQKWPDCPWVFPSWQGKQLHANNFRNRVWRPAFNASGLSRATWHDLRHNAASWLVQNGEGLYTVQKFLGQDDSRMVERYAHLGKEKLRGAAEKLNSVVQENI